MRLLRQLVGAVGQVSSGIRGRISCTSMFKASKKAKSAMAHIRTLMVGKLLHRRKTYSTCKTGKPAEERRETEAEILVIDIVSKEEDIDDVRKRHNSCASKSKIPLESRTIQKEKESSFSCLNFRGERSAIMISKSLNIAVIRVDIMCYSCTSSPQTRWDGSQVSPNGGQAPKTMEDESEALDIGEVGNFPSGITELCTLSAKGDGIWTQDQNQPEKRQDKLAGARKMLGQKWQESFLQLIRLSKHIDAG